MEDYMEKAKEMYNESVIEHINTGCMYDEKGQVITIVWYKDKAFFSDWSRGIQGELEGPDLKIKVGNVWQVINRYLQNHYKHAPMEASWMFRVVDIKNTMFKDWSTEYKLNTMF